MTGQELLDATEALNTILAAGTNIDHSIPSPDQFASKAAFFAFVDSANDTQTEIETTLIRAAWLRYLNFEDDDRETDGPVRTFIFEATVFHESHMERVDESVPLDDFEKRVNLKYHEHVTAVSSLTEPGVTPIPALSAYAVAEYNTPAQIEDTQMNVPCEFMPSVTGHQTKLEYRVRVQMPC